ncbi:MAG: sugar phosphate isomerase/epimerase [Pseudomonadota bacterium]
MPRVAYQLYCSRNFPPLLSTLKMLADAGYREVEGYGALLEDMTGVKEALDETGLRMTSAHIGLEMLENDPATALQIVSSLGVEKAFGPYLAAEERPTDSAGWRSFAKRLYAAGAPLRDAGVAFGWHNHDFEFDVTPEGDLPMDLIADVADDMLLELDLGWVRVAGLDPVERINAYGSKITVAHIKDIAPDGECVDEDGWADVGQGIMEWSAIHAALQANGVDHYIVEHDNPSDHRRFATRSLAAIQNF